MPNENPSGQGAFNFNLRFAGQYFDRETNLNYNINRDYDSATGRYIESDPLGLAAGINTYAYVDGNPLSFVDPFGLRIFNPSGAVILDEVMESLREFNKKIGCDKDISITGGDRPASAKIGAGNKSTHVQHLAADIKVRDQTHLETANQARLSGLFGGIGWYEEGYSGPRGEGPHVHVDLRDGSAMWGYDKNGKEYHRSFPRYSSDQKLSTSPCGCE